MNKLKSDLMGMRPLLITIPKAQAHLAKVDNFLSGIKAERKLDESVYGAAEAFFGPASSMKLVYPYAIIHLKGVIGKNLPEMERLTGSCDLQEIEEMLEEAKADKNVKHLILHVDSPGGNHVGVPELAAKVKNFGKPTTGVVDNEACSAGYWILSQCDEVYATPSSSVGSVGCYIAFWDTSEAYKAEGIKVELLKSGLYKGLGYDGLPLDDAGRKLLLDEVKTIHEEFKADVKAVRTLVDDSSMEGQAISGKKGADLGLVTGLCQDVDEVLEKLDERLAAQMEALEAEAVEAEAEEEEAEEGEEGLNIEASKIRALRKELKKALKIKAEDSMPKAEDEADDEDEGEEGEKGEEEVTEDKGPHVVICDYTNTIKAEDGLPHPGTVKHIEDMKAEGHKVHIVSGQPEAHRVEIEEFLKHAEIKHDGLHLRVDAYAEDEDTKPAYKVAKVKHIEDKTGYKIKHIVEDEDNCCKAYEEAGYNCIKPHELSDEATDHAEAEAEASEKAVETDKKHDVSDASRHRGGSII